MVKRESDINLPKCFTLWGVDYILSNNLKEHVINEQNEL